MDLTQINTILSNPSWDLIVIFLFIAFGFFYGISSGKKKLISLLISFYTGGFFFSNFFYIDYLIKGRTILETFLLKSFLFLAIVLTLNLIFLRILDGSSSSGEWWQVLLLSFIETGLLFSFIFHLFPAKDLFTFSPVVKYLFVSDKSFTLWLIAPLVGLFLVRK